jgi:cation-transporting ATPase 13A3/4/5
VPKSQQTISSDNLVPGDVIEVPENTLMPCDVVLLYGSAIVNEAMLTGESVPVIKNGITKIDKFYDPLDQESSKKHTLYSGTKVIQTRAPGDQKVHGLVIRTGYLTTKGSLIRDILYPREVNFAFYRDSLIFVGLMGLVAVFGFLISIPKLIEIGTKTDVLIDKSLDLITITVPPALPAAMSVGVAFAIQRLRKRQIFCISPNRVNVSGRVQIMVFDKTGTLTEDGLQVMGVRACRGRLSPDEDIDSQTNQFSEFASTIQDVLPAFSRDLGYLDHKSVILNEAMASCHAITWVGDELVGDPLEIKMFQSTDWILDEVVPKSNSLVQEDDIILAKVKRSPFSNAAPLNSFESEVAGGGQDNYELAIIKRYDFEASLQRMSVVVKNWMDMSTRVYVKGSPEKIMELCHPSSIPSDFHQALEEYTRKGYRVIALGFKNLEKVNFLQIQAMHRDNVENELFFLGLLVMENRLKATTRDTIKTLNTCHIRTIMATGDNTLTAISVGRECNILHGDQDVYFGDVDNDRIVWKKTKGDQNADELDGSVRGSVAHKPQDTFEGLDSQYEVPWEVEQASDFGVALNGKTLDFLNNHQDSHESVLLKVLLTAQVYARMSPDDKANLVSLLQTRMQKQIGMCGDGANDCAALKQADAGISLSEAEASIAAPFTSKVFDISCVEVLLREGRAAL